MIRSCVCRLAAIVCVGLFVFAATLGCSPRVDARTAANFEQAQKAFDTAKSKPDFLRVAGMYEQIIRSGVQSGVIYYNQGNAYMRAGERGRAIASYRQAKRFRPRDPLLDANLRAALQGRELAASRPLLEYLLFWQNGTSYPAKFQASVMAAVVTFSLAMMGLVFASSLWKRLAWLALVVSLAIAASAAYDWYRFDYVGHGVVVVAEAVARKGNAASYEPAFTAPLAEGTEFVVLEQRGDWMRVQVSGGQEGWLRAVEVVVY